MIRIPEMLNHSDDLSEDSGSTPSSTTPSAMSLGESSSSLNTASSSGSYGADRKRVKSEPKEGLADEVKHNIESDLPKRYKASPVNPPTEPPPEFALDKSERSSPESDLNGTNEELTRLSIQPNTLPVSRINKRLLSKKLVQIAIRRKSVSQMKDTLASHQTAHNCKLHTKSLEAGLRVKLTLAPDLFSLYKSLTPHTNRKQSLTIYNSNIPGEHQNGTYHGEGHNVSHMESKTVQLIDNNLVNMSGFSNKVLKAFKPGQNGFNRKASKPKTTDSTGENGILPTFNSLDTAVYNLFGIKEYSLVRITRSTTNDQDGSILLKFETAKSGELNLIDDEDFTDDLLHSIGKPNDVPSNLFIKKVLARPRYKSDMKIYIIPKDVNSSLYIDQRMFERDLINGVIDINLPFYKNIYCTFGFEEIVGEYMRLLQDSKRANQQDHSRTQQDQGQSQNHYLPIQSSSYIPYQTYRPSPPGSSSTGLSPNHEFAPISKIPSTQIPSGPSPNSLHSFRSQFSPVQTRPPHGSSDTKLPSIVLNDN